MKARKKGNIMLFAFVFILLFLTLAGVYINVGTSWEVYNRVQTATEEAAKNRAQAIDIYLKESTGIVEAFHPATGYGDGKYKDVEHDKYTKIIGHSSPHLPSSASYIGALNQADESTKQVLVTIAEKSLRGTNAGNKILENFSKNNICIQVKPLPRTVFEGLTMDFECTTANGHTVKATNIKVSPIESSQNRKVVFDPGDGGEKQMAEVVNVVFVASAFEHRNFLENLFPNISDNIDNTPYKTTWAIAYPQIDRCFGEFCANY